MEKINLKTVVLSPEAQAAFNDMVTKLRTFSAMIGKNEEPETWGELKGKVLVLKTKADTAKGQVTMDLDIPPEHWQYAH